MPLEVVAYDPSWPALFESVRSDLEVALRNVPLIGIEHVGSTSVPGLAAKPIIDIDVIVEADIIRPAIEALTDAGYRHLGDLGIADRHAMSAPDKSPRRNVYVTLHDSLALRNHLGVRDTLRSDAELCHRYAEVKARLADEDGMDIARYTQAKTSILSDILEAAGLTPAEISAIAGANLGDRR